MTHFEIKRATEADVVEMRRWLQEEDREAGHSFICNFELIENGLGECRRQLESGSS